MPQNPFWIYIEISWCLVICGDLCVFLSLNYFILHAHKCSFPMFRSSKPPINWHSLKCNSIQQHKKQFQPACPMKKKAKSSNLIAHPTKLQVVFLVGRCFLALHKGGPKRKTRRPTPTSKFPRVSLTSESQVFNDASGGTFALKRWLKTKNNGSSPRIKS